MRHDGKQQNLIYTENHTHTHSLLVLRVAIPQDHSSLNINNINFVWISIHCNDNREYNADMCNPFVLGYAHTRIYASPSPNLSTSLSVSRSVSLSLDANVEDSYAHGNRMCERKCERVESDDLRVGPLA